MTPLLRLTLVRHGETDGQSSIRYHGRTDVALSTVGRRQMECVRHALHGRMFDAVYASTLSRSVEGAAIVSGGAAVRRIAAFDEINFGDWEGLTVEEIAANAPEVYARWCVRTGDFQYPGGESSASFRARVVRALHELLAGADRGELLFVVHKGVIRCVLTELLRIDETHRVALAVELASIHVVGRVNGVWAAEMLDCTTHL